MTWPVEFSQSLSTAFLAVGYSRGLWLASADGLRSERHAHRASSSAAWLCELPMGGAETQSERRMGYPLRRVILGFGTGN